jgi:hypothetical protein
MPDQVRHDSNRIGGSRHSRGSRDFKGAHNFTFRVAVVEYTSEALGIFGAMDRPGSIVVKLNMADIYSHPFLTKRDAPIRIRFLRVIMVLEELLLTITAIINLTHLRTHAISLSDS